MDERIQIKLGDYNTLRVVKRVDFGLYLDGGDAGEILLPQRYVPENIEIDDEIEVFLYLDIDERLVATTLHPVAKVGEFASLEVAWTNKYGAFLKWGLMKDLFCPFREQQRRMETGDRHIVYITLDEDSYRLMATAKVEKHLSKDAPDYKEGQEVNLLIYQHTDLGFKAIINNSHVGLVYRDQIFRPIHIGDTMKGYVQTVRKDGKIDLALQPNKKQLRVEFAEQLLSYLKENGGFCHLGDKSPAEEIYSVFEVSKKTFKKGLGDLYRRRLVSITDEGIRLL